MGAETKIEWCDYTFNPWRGCTKVDASCKHCYAETMSKRNPKVLGVWGDSGTRVIASESMWRQPVIWNHKAGCIAAATGVNIRPRVFCASMADVFEDRADLVEPRKRLFDLIDATPNLYWLLLTKRPKNVKRMLVFDWWLRNPGKSLERIIDENLVEPRPNVWLGTSVSDQESADKRIPELLQVPAAVRFLSVEPLLGPVDLTHVPLPDGDRLGTGLFAHGDGCGIDWVIVGGESGGNARPCNVAWIRSIVAQCAAARFPCFVKQLGARPVGWCATQGDSDADGHETDHCDAYEGSEISQPCPAGHCAMRVDRKGGDSAEWPDDLRVRQFPSTA